MTMIVERVGLTTVQDFGRSGWAHIGVPHSGAADRTSFLLANRLVGNAPSAAMFETSGGVALRMLADTAVVITGADCDATIDDRPLSRCKATRVRAGQLVHIHRVHTGVRSYVAFAGGIDAPLQLGSLSHDTLSDIAPLRLTVGTTITLGVDHDASSSLDMSVNPRSAARLGLIRGPHYDLFDNECLEQLVHQPWRVSSEGDRIGIRLRGAPLPRGEQHELPSFPLVRGAVQITPGGELVVMLADHPTTGGYPVIGVLAAADVDDVAQRPAEHAVAWSWLAR